MPIDSDRLSKCPTRILYLKLEGLRLRARRASPDGGPRNTPSTDGQCHRRCLFRWANVKTLQTGYCLLECGRSKDFAFVSADGRCEYNEDCAPDDPRLLAGIAHVAQVEVRPAAPAPPPAINPTRPSSNHLMRRLRRSPPMCRTRISRRR